METEEPHFLDTLHHDLALALGDAIWAFAKLERLTCRWIGLLTAPGVDELVVDLGFEVRAKMLKRLVRRNTEDEKRKLVETIAKLANEGSDLAARRNVIAHNPWTIWIDFDADDFMTEIQKYADETNKLDLNELREFTESCDALERQLKEALIAFSDRG